MPPRRQGLSYAAIEQLIAQCVVDAMTAYEANQNRGNRINNEASGCASRGEHRTRSCSYKEFLICKPHNFNGTEGTVGLARWFGKMESVFRICNCAKNRQMKYATCSLLDGALTWWNAHIQSVGIDATYETTWKELKKMMTEEYFLRNEVQKMETKLWNLTIKGTDIVGYNKRFQELALLCPGHTRKYYPDMENQNGAGEACQNPNVVTGTFYPKDR
ncbi:reverse transcriptase domain-containing protein [Tanacetum coccineum]